MKTIARPRRSLAVRSSGPYALSNCWISTRLRCFTHWFALTSHDLYINHIILTKTVNIQKLGHFQKALWGKLTNSSKYFQSDFDSFTVLMISLRDPGTNQQKIKASCKNCRPASQRTWEAVWWKTQKYRRKRKTIGRNAKKMYNLKQPRLNRKKNQFKE